ncbi:MAG: glycosyltransferase, partial [Rhodobacteraceae bacterium]|nr:glycosyltransferase [Paracoccaceae bacterium]
MSAALALLAASFLVFHLLSVALFLRRPRRTAPRPGFLGRPPVTLLRPVCGRDAHDEETLASSLTQDYPDYEVVFCVARADDPVLPLLRGLLDRSPVPARLLVGWDRPTGNPKLDNVWKGWQATRRDWVCMTDSNLLLPPDYLSIVVDSWGPDCGRLQYLADSFAMGFAQGKTLFFNKPLLEAQGGLEVLGQTLAEDVAATHVTRALGA